MLVSIIAGASLAALLGSMQDRRRSECAPAHWPVDDADAPWLSLDLIETVLIGRA